MCKRRNYINCNLPPVDVFDVLNILYYGIRKVNLYYAIGISSIWNVNIDICRTKNFVTFTSDDQLVNHNIGPIFQFYVKYPQEQTRAYIY